MFAIKKILPKYAILPIIAMLMLNMITYFGTRLFTTGMVHHNLGNMFDDMIPFWSASVIIYVLAYVHWIVGFLMIARENEAICYRFVTGEMIAKTLCLIFFIVYPTTIIRPEIAGTGVFDKLAQLIYNLDAPDNLFPSIHCLESWICFRGALYLKKVPRWYMPIMFVSAVLVFASTVLLKQHVLIDIVGAIIVAEIGLFVSRYIKFDKLLRRDHG